MARHPCHFNLETENDVTHFTINRVDSVEAIFDEMCLDEALTVAIHSCLDAVPHVELAVATLVDATLLGQIRPTKQQTRLLIHCCT
jgi:hypothetical protein